MLIGQLAERSGVKPETIRYYEKIGLLPLPQRTDTGYRVYTRNHIASLQFIRGARALGFSLSDIRELLSLSEAADGDCTAIDAIANRHLATVRTRLQQLHNLEAELERMIHACRGDGVPECRILMAIPNVEQQG